MNKHLPVLSKLVLCTALAASLSGCVGMMVGGAVMGVAAAVDRRTLGAQTDDAAFEMKANKLISPIIGETGHVNVTSYNRKVLLTGEVTDEAMKQEIDRVVRAIDGVQNVVNELQVLGSTSITSRSADALITTRVKAGLVDMKTISANSFKVVTERGVVYLMGRVTEREGFVGAEVARKVGGVARVVKLFEYITEEELQAIEPAPLREVQL